MAGGVSLSSALQLLDGNPHKKAGSAFVEKIPFAKVLSGGNLGGLTQKVLQDGNLSSIMQNPMAALTGAIQGQIPGLVSQLQGMAGGGPTGLIQALSGAGGLGSGIGAFRASGDNLVGLTGGGAGFFSLLGHDSLAQMIGPSLPPAASLGAVMAPLNSGPFLESVTTQLPIVVSAVVSGAMSAADATTWVQAQTATAGGLVAGSAGALAWGQSMQTLVSTVSTVAGALAVPPVLDAQGRRQGGGATGLQRVLAGLVQPGPLAAMNRAVEAQIAHTRHAPVDIGALTSLED